MMSAESLIALADQVDWDDFVTQMPVLAVQGRYWWFRLSDLTFHATTVWEPPSEGDEYLLDASPAWVESWGGNWDAAADSLMEVLVRAMDSEVA